MTVLRRAAAALITGLIVLALATLTATPALAHAALESSTPAQGAALATPPTTVSLTFAEAVTVAAAPIQVTGPGGIAWTVGAATVTGATVSAPVTATGPAGPYTMAWSVISDDGDKVTGKIAFTLTAAAAPPTTTPAPTTVPPTTAPTTTDAAASTTAAPAAAATAPANDGGGVWVWVVIAVVVLTGIAAAIGRRRRSDRP